LTDAQNNSAQNVTTRRASEALSPRPPANGPVDVETKTVKLLLSLAALTGSLGLLLSDWAGQAFPYL